MTLTHAFRLGYLIVGNVWTNKALLPTTSLNDFSILASMKALLLSVPTTYIPDLWHTGIPGDTFSVHP